MVGESYEATSWRSGPLSIVSARKSIARQHWRKDMEYNIVDLLDSLDLI